MSHYEGNNDQTPTILTFSTAQNQAIGWGTVHLAKMHNLLLAFSKGQINTHCTRGNWKDILKLGHANALTGIYVQEQIQEQDRGQTLSPSFDLTPVPFLYVEQQTPMPLKHSQCFLTGEWSG